MHSPDPSIATIGDPSNLNNYLPDSGATQHMTPRLADLQDVVGGQKLGVKVADGHVIKCSSTGTICIAMQDDNGINFQAFVYPDQVRQTWSPCASQKQCYHTILW
jgi:hypothetical protein